MNTQLKLILVMGIGTVLMACQSQPVKTTSSHAQRTVHNTPAVTTKITTREVPVIRSKDGVQDIRWVLSQVKFKQAMFFNAQPYLLLNSANQRVQAHTGCNPIYGTYQANVAAKTIKFDVSAGHSSCDKALSQEADLMDAFASAEYFQVTGKTIQFMDKNRQVLMSAEQR